MSARSFERWETQIHTTARVFPYPPTPDLAAAVRRRLVDERAHPTSPYRRLAWAATILLVILAGLLAVPQVRAAVLEALRLGAIHIFLAEPTPAAPPSTPTVARPTSAVPLASGAPMPAAPASPAATATRPRPPTAPRPSPTPSRSVLNLAGETTLAAAEAKAGFPVLLPTYPPDLGPPDRVYLQDLGGPAVILVWLVSESQDEVRMSLYELGEDVFGAKSQPEVIQATAVNGQRALWVRGPHILQFRDRQGRTVYEPRRLVEGNVLVWVQEQITYRLESHLSLKEAVRVAESLR